MKSKHFTRFNPTMGKLREMEELVRKLEDQVSELSAQKRDLETLATKDYLTGLLNRRGLEEALEVEMARANRVGTTLTVVFLDIDHFKMVNDTHGHPVGDVVLRQLGQILRQECRSSDIIGRYGGEEFIIAFQGGDVRGNLAYVNRIRMAVKENLVIARENSFISVTASFGMAEKKSFEKIDLLFARADSALYAAKQGGRNQVIHSDLVH